jgi:hypothetical protein
VAGDYPPQNLTQDQRQWLYNVFHPGTHDTASVGYGGERCGGNATGDSNQTWFDAICAKSDRGPNGIRPGAYNPQELTQDQRNWLWAEFHPAQANQGASQGYGGEMCSWQNGQNMFNPNLVTATPQPQQQPQRTCPGGTGPNGITANSYPPQNLTQAQRQWLWNTFGHNSNETAPVGYGGEGCSNPQPWQPGQQNQQPQQPVSSGNDHPIGSDGKPFDRNQPFVSGIPSLAQARQGNDGGVDLATFCAAIGKDAHPTNNGGQWTWQCPGGPVMTRDYWNSTVCPFVWHVGWIVDNSHGNGTGDLRCKSNGSVNTNNGNNGNGGSQSSNTGFVPRSATCPPNFPQRLSVGLNAREIPDGNGPANVRPVPGDPSITTKIQEGDIVSVIDGPVCLVSDAGQPYRLFKIRTSNGVEGWTPEADNTHYFLEPWQDKGQQQQSSQQNNAVNVPFSYAPFNLSFNFVIEKRGTTCWIVNGSSFVATELSRYRATYAGRSLAQQYIITARYLADIVGSVENMRHAIESTINKAISCESIYYQVGIQSMDTSGVGNIAFGFTTVLPGIPPADLIANVAQIGSSGHFGDNPDDVSQRSTGEAIAVSAGMTIPITPQLVEMLAQAHKLW